MLIEQKSPGVYPFLRVFYEDDNLFLEVNDLSETANLLCGNYKIHPYSEKSYQGYITLAESSCVATTFENQSTEKIGEQIRLNTVKLRNTSSEETFEVEWQQNLKSFKFEAVQGCIQKSFLISTSVQPGETVVASEDFIVVNLAEINSFYGDKAKIYLDKESRLLYFGFDFDFDL
ncbi:MAG: hypothetical protein AAF348_01655 [Bacteroidota bacterium]